MRKRNIRMNQLTDIYEFVNKASKVDGDIYLSRGAYVVDAKSLLGVFSIDMSQAAMLSYPEDATEFEAYAAQFTV